MANGLVAGDQKAARAQWDKLTAQAKEKAKQQIIDTLKDPGKTGEFVGNLAMIPVGDGAASLLGKGVGAVGRGIAASGPGQRVIAGAGRSAAKLNRGLDAIANGMFPGGPKGPGGLAVAGGGTVGGTVARTGGGGLNIAPMPRGLGGAGVVGTANLMAGKGNGGTPALPDSDWSPESVDGRVADGRVTWKTQPITYLQGQKVDVLGKQIKLDVDLAPTISNIKSGVKVYSQDGKVYNGSGLAPRPKGYYQEYVVPTSGVNGAGSQRIVVGKGGEMYYTPDHYDSFIKLVPNK